MNRRQVVRRTSAGLCLFGGCVTMPTTPRDESAVTTASGYGVSVSQTDASAGGTPLQFSVSAVDETATTGDPAQLRFVLENTATGTDVELHGGPLFPFGVLVASQMDADNRFILWNDRYTQNENVSVTADSINVATIGKIQRLSPGQTVSDRYAIRATADGVRPGTFHVHPFNRDDLSFGRLQSEVTLTITDTT